MSLNLIDIANRTNIDNDNMIEIVLKIFYLFLKPDLLKSNKYENKIDIFLKKYNNLFQYKKYNKYDFNIKSKMAYIKLDKKKDNGKTYELIKKGGYKVIANVFVGNETVKIIDEKEINVHIFTIKHMRLCYTKKKCCKYNEHFKSLKLTYFLIKKRKFLSLLCNK